MEMFSLFLALAWIAAWAGLNLNELKSALRWVSRAFYLWFEIAVTNIKR